MKTILLAFLLLAGDVGYSQVATALRPATLGINVNTHRFGKQLIPAKSNSYYTGLSLQYAKGIRSRLDYGVALGGTFLDTAFGSGPRSGESHLLLEGSVSFRARLLAPRFPVQPFFQTGLNLLSYQSHIGPAFTLGTGLEIHFKDIYIGGSLNYRPVFSSSVKNHWLYSMGISGVIFKNKSEKRKKLPIQSFSVVTNRNDLDGDGIIDSLDTCPTIPGTIQFRGCPDSDNDGIEDRFDKCPTIPGSALYQGCPVPDSDQDGINDRDDKCPTVPGVKAFGGCPIPDMDGDGVLDSLDKCPQVRGDKKNSGCPVPSIQDSLQAAAGRVFFENNSYQLSASSFTSLHQVVALLNNHPTVSIVIEGHTDNVGTKIKNQKLSEKRALAVKKYLITHGIDVKRLLHAGYGQERPVDSNDTEKGRQNNRRVVFVLLK